MHRLPKIQTFSSVTFSDPLPAVSILEYSIDSLKIAWTRSKYKAKYGLYTASDFSAYTFFKTINDTFLLIKHPSFPDTYNYTLYVSSIRDSSYHSDYSGLVYFKYSTDNNINEGYNISYAYNVYENMLYVNSSYGVYGFSSPDNQKLSSYWKYNNQNYFLISCPVNSMGITAQINN